MGQRVHQEDEDKLKATVKQKEKDRTVTGTVTASYNPEEDDNSLPIGEDRETPNVLLYAYDYVGKVWRRAKMNVSHANAIFVEAYQTEKDRTVTGTVTAAQTVAANLKATVTQADSNRIVTGTVTANPTPLYTMLSSEVTLTSANNVYTLPHSEQPSRIVLVIYNISDTTVYIGGPEVATTDGMPLAPSKYMVIPALANVYAVCGSAGKKLRLLECK